MAMEKLLAKAAGISRVQPLSKIYMLQKIRSLCILGMLFTDAIKLFLLEAGKLAISQEQEGLVTGHLDTGFSWFPWVLE